MQADSQLQQYTYLRELAKNFNVLPLAAVVIDNPKFIDCSGSSCIKGERPKHHHYGRGGLIKHTKEVVDLCLNANKYYGDQIDPKIVYLAALYHDVGKIEDYEYNIEHGEWLSTDHKYMIHHIQKSYLIWEKAATEYGFPENNIFQVSHAILSHHGHREWGSPVEPKTKLAFILHYSDAISARFDDCYFQ